MSFSSDIKEKISDVASNCPECDIYTLAGFLGNAGKMNKDAIVLITENKIVAEKIAEIINKIYKDVVYVLDPVREKRLQGFIDKVIEISELYELDIKINKHLSHVTVDYFFDGGGDMRYLLEVIKMADNIAFFPNNSGYALVVCLDFYTHIEYRNGRQINP